jgi:hypothetical protein
MLRLAQGLEAAPCQLHWCLAAVRRAAFRCAVLAILYARGQGTAQLQAQRLEDLGAEGGTGGAGSGVGVAAVSLPPAAAGGFP